MEGKEDLQSYEVSRQGEDVPNNYMSGNSGVVRESTTPVAVAPAVAPVGGVAPAAAVAAAAVAPPVMAAPSPVGGVEQGTEGKKRRGRPRKYGPDGKGVVALSPMPISASIPLSGDYSTWKRGRGRQVDSYKKKHNIEYESPGEQVEYSVGSDFTPHVITVNAGEDVTMRIIAFSQQGSRVVCILAANGAISNVTLHQPNSFGGTLTYEGHYEILSLSGSYIPTDSGGTKIRTGGMSVSLASPDGRILGGGLAGLLVAAGPVQVVIGSFLHGYQQEHNPSKQKFEVAPPLSPIFGNHTSGYATNGVFSAPKPIFTPLYHGNNLIFGNSGHGSKILGNENGTS